MEKRVGVYEKEYEEVGGLDLMRDRVRLEERALYILETRRLGRGENNHKLRVKTLSTLQPVRSQRFHYDAKHVRIGKLRFA